MRLFYSILSSLLFLILTSCQDFKDVTVTRINEFHVTKITAEGIEGQVSLNIKNPNSFGFNIYPSEFDVTFSGVNMGKAQLKQKTHIDANADKSYPFTINTSFKNVNLMDITKLLGSIDNLGAIEVKGELRAGKFFYKKRIPVNLKDRIPLSK